MTSNCDGFVKNTGIFPVEVDLNILVVQENYSGGKSMAVVHSLCQLFYRNCFLLLTLLCGA